ncbi:MAG TPA: hypothetical protein VNB89_10185, partial [Gemmatimonadaceae bacterium]|nr:hypothetical protein [Gemmatimonadaceae bacterium]
RGLGRVADATNSLQDAMRIASRLQTRLLQAEVQREFGLLASEMGDREEATRQLTAALAGFTELGAQRECIEVRVELRALDES